MFWKRYAGRIERPIELEGDPKVPATTWWNRFFVRLYWDECTVLEVPEGEDAYRVGFIPESGPAMYLTRIIRTRRFSVRHGREDCRFFAVKLDGTELPLKVAFRTNLAGIPNSVTEV